MKRTLILAPALALFFTVLNSAPASAQVMRGFLYYNGSVVRTVIVPARLPMGGRDPLFMVTNGVPGQLGIAGAAPGAPRYFGGRWAVYLVTFQAGATPVLLTSREAVLQAQAMGLVTVVRAPAMDFRCPILP